MTKNGTASSTGILNGVISRESVTLNVRVSDVDIYLYAADQQVIGGEAIDDESVRNTTVVVHISLIIPAKFTPPDAIASLTVELKSEETLGFPSGLYERNHPNQVRQRVESATGMQLERGKEYQWDVPLQISALSAPYERGVYGRLFHKISATVEWRGLTGWIRAGKTLVAEKAVFLTEVPETTNVLNYEYTHHGHSETLGPVILHNRSRQLSVGGYLRVALSLPRLNAGSQVHKLVLTLIQNTTLVSRKDPGHSEQCQPQRKAFLEIEREELQKAVKASVEEVGREAINAHWIARLPHDQEARSTTLYGNQAAIRHDHALELSLTYRGSETDSLRTYTSSWPILLPNCSLTLHRIKLPSYSQYDPSPVPEQGRDDWEPDKYANIHLSQAQCACGQTLEKLLSWEDEGDDEAQTWSSVMMREAVRSATSSIELNRRARGRSRNRSSSRQTSGLSREASARPSLDSHEERSSIEVEDAAEEEERRHRQKRAQQYL